METLWKVVGFVLGLISAQLCNGLPINLTTAGPDPNTQYLTGLVAVLLAICSIILLAGCVCCRRNKNGFTEFRDSPVVASVASNLDHGHVNPIANSEFTIFTPISPTHHNNNVFLANQRIVNRTQEDFKYGDIDVSSWFDGSEKDFPRTRLKYIRELGKGWFGRIVEGTAQGLSQDPGEPEWTPVVVRILEASASSKERVLFLHDADVYRHGYHPNILLLLGRCLDTSPLLLLQEYCSEGDLKKYLRSMKSTKEKFLSSDLPLLWCYQLTQALKFLHEQGIPHPDLAARNCQLTKDLTLKLGDYGLNSSFYPEDYYQGSLAVPLRWCAPEIISYTNTTIQTKKPTLEGNIWSLGITMWEIMECGEQPYSELGDDDVISQVLGSANIRLPRPTFNVIYTDYMYELMQSCWSTAESRRSATHIDLRLNDLMQVYENTKVSMEQKGATSIQDFEQRWDALKPNGMITDETPLMQEDKKSESLTNLHGSLDNLLDDANPMDSWLENVANNTGDLVYAKGLSEAMMDLDNALDLSSDSNEPSPRPLHFQLGQKVITTSESETEDENWKKKIECGAYTEKVRQKSRSVADLMILTHVDYSESDSETLPSLTEYKNQKPKYFNKNMENPALKFGSEGNLLSVHDTFQEELRKLQDERRDSLLFVPDKYSYTDSKSAESSSSRQLDSLENSPVKKLIVELNSPSEMIPPKQVYNVFNVSVKHLNNLGEVDNKNDRKGLQKKTSCDSLKESKDNRDINHIKNNSFPPEKTITGRDVSCDKTKTKSEQNDEVFAYHTKVPSNLDKKPKSFENLNDFHIKIEVLSDQSSPIEEEITSQDLDRPGSSDDYMKETRKLHVPKLSEIIQRNVTLKSSNEDKLLLTKFTDKDLVDKDSGLNTPENSASLEKLYDDIEEILDEPSVLKKCSKCAISFEENEVYTGSFDSDKSNDIKVDLHKDLCLLKEEIKISSSDGSGCEEDSGTGTSSKETQSIDDNLSAKSLEDALDMINNDYCLRRSKIICESFLANEKSNYSPTDEYREICFVTNTKLTDFYLEEKSHKDISHQIQLIPDLLTGLPDVDKNYKDDKIETLTEYLLKPLIHMENFQTMESKTSNSLNTESNSNNLNLTKTSVILPIIKSSPNDKESEDSISSSKSDSIESVAEFLSPEISQASDFKTISECSQNNASLALAIDSSVPNTMLDVSSEEMKTLEDADSTKTLGGDSDSDVNNMEEFSECQLKHSLGESRDIDISTDKKEGEYQETLRLVRRDSFDILRKTKEFLCQELVFYDKEDISDVLLRNSFNKDIEATEDVNELNDVNITSLSKIIHIKEEFTDKLLNDEETSSNIQRVNLNEIRDADNREQNVKIGQSSAIPSNNFIKELSDVNAQFEEVFENKLEDRIINNAISNVSVIGDNNNEVSEGTDKDNKMNESQAITKESHLIGNTHERLSVQELSETFEPKYENVDNQKQLEKNLSSTTDDAISLIKQLQDNTTTHETQVPNFLTDNTNNINQQPDLLITINDRTVTSESSLDSFLGMFENSEDCTKLELDLSKDCDHEKLDSDKISTVSVNTIEKPEKKILEEFGVLSMSSKEETVQSKSVLNKVCSNENIESNKQTDLKCDTEQIENCRLDENEVTLQVQEPKFEAGEFQVFTMETSETSPIEDRSEIHKINSPPEYPIVEDINKSNLEIVEKSMSEKCDVLLGDKMVEVKNCSDLSYANSKEKFGDLPSNQESESEVIVEMVEKPVSERCGIENLQSETLHPYSSDFNSSSKSCTKNPLDFSGGNPIITEQSINIIAPMLENEFEKEETNQDLNCFNDHEPHENVDHHTASLIQDSNYTRPMNESICQSATIQCQLANAEIHPSNVENQTNLDMSDLPITSKVVKKEPISSNTTRDTPDFELVKNSMGTSIEDGCNIRSTIAAGYNKDTVLNISETSEMTHNKSLEINSKNEELNPIEVEDILINFTTENTKNIDILSNSKDTPNAPTSLLKQEEEVKELFQSLLGDPVKEENFNQLQTILNKTKDFLNNEIEAYADKPKQELLVQFDLSDSQEEIAPNSLTHFQGFTSTPFSKKRSLESTVILGANDDYSMDFYSGLKTAVDPVEAEELKFSSNFMQEGCREQNNDLYSLETWDNFLGKSFDEQENDLDFITFNQEPHSLLFLENNSAEYEDKLERTNNLQVSHVVNETYVPENQNGDKTFCKEPCSDKTCNVMNEQDGDVTYTKNDGTFVKNESINEHLNVDLGKPSTSTGWESGGGWFLHPQSNSEELSGQIAVQESTVDSYVGFSMDDEIMAAIRNELLNKLPHAQRASSEHVKEQEELEPAEKNEVFIRYNVYNTPLSPIPEESYIGSDDDSPIFTPKRVNQVSDDDSSDWSIEDNVSSNLHTEINSPKLESCMISSPAKFPNHRHTPSQDSCCSNDTLFNIEDLNLAIEHDRIFETIPDEDESSKESKYSDCKAEIEDVEDDTLINDKLDEKEILGKVEVPKISIHNYITDFLNNERYNQLNSCIELSDLRSEYEECSSASDKYLTVSDNTLSFGQNVAPLNSPEDRQWKDLQASFRDCEEVEDPSNKLNTKFLTPIENTELDDVQKISRSFELVTDLDDPDLDNLEDCRISDEDIDKVLQEEDEEFISANKEGLSNSNTKLLVDNISPNLDKEGISSTQKEDNRIYVNTPSSSEGNTIIQNTDLDVTEYDGSVKNEDSPEYVYIEKHEDNHEYENGWIADTIYANMPADRAKELDYVIAEENKKAEENIEDLYGPLADIRFSGPGLANLQIMSTSFSESNEVGDEQDWDSGSDTRSSSSGEFIWREGEHEASLKALDAAPQSENTQELAPMEDIQEENESSSSDSDGEGECPEFVPSAWDKYAIPTKSALRSPEKTLERKEAKDKKVVWFKKQKYHCIYEYPKEPDSPILQSYDLWKPTPDYATLADWELGPDMYVPRFDLIEPLTSVTDQQRSPKNLYHLTAFPEKGATVLDDDFYVSSSSKPFDMLGGMTSQFFPGQQFSDHWVDATTPDSGDEVLPVRENNRIPTLKHLATIAANKNRKLRDLGGLRHTRSKLKLDLPPSPSAFSSNTTFTVEPVEEIVPRQVPTFSTFGKSRFLVQHVDTPPDDKSTNKNVSFEALPYKPQAQTVKERQKIESVRGEASLLDSADEDSGIDSSTLERGKKVGT